MYYSLVQESAPGMEGLFSFLQAIFAKNSVLQKNRKKLQAAIKEGACSISEPAVSNQQAHSGKASRRG